MIWPFSNKPKKSLEEIVPGGFCDIHCHPLWGIDDGAVDQDESLAMLRGLGRLGYRRVAATHHHFHSMFKNPDPQLLTSRLKSVNDHLGQGGPEVLPGAEIMVHDDLGETIRGELCPGIGGQKIYLIEFTGAVGSVPAFLEQLVFDLRVADIAVVLAHVERYPDFRRNPQRLARLRSQEVVVQIDLPSLWGKYGNSARETGWELLNEGVADVVASDLHRAGELGSLGETLAELAQWNESELVRLASTNPGLLLDGKPWELVRND